MKTLVGSHENWSGARRSIMATIRMAIERARSLR